MRGAELFGRNQDVPPLVFSRGSRRDMAGHAHQREHCGGAPRTRQSGGRAQRLQLADAEAGAAAVRRAALVQIKREPADQHAPAVIDQHIEQPVAAEKRDHSTAERPDCLGEVRVRAQFRDRRSGQRPIRSKQRRVTVQQRSLAHPPTLPRSNQFSPGCDQFSPIVRFSQLLSFEFRIVRAARG